MIRDNKCVVLSELNGYSRQGATLYLRGEPKTPDQLAEIMCVRESHCLMRDYVFKGEDLKEVHFDWVRNDRKKRKQNKRTDNKKL